MSGVNWWLVAVGNLLVCVPLWWWLQELEAAAKWDGHKPEFGLAMGLGFTLLDWYNYGANMKNRQQREAKGEIVKPFGADTEKVRQRRFRSLLYIFSAVGIISSSVRFFFDAPSVGAIFLYATILPLLFRVSAMLKLHGLSTGILARTEPRSTNQATAKEEVLQKQSADAEIRLTAPEESQKLERRR